MQWRGVFKRNSISLYLIDSMLTGAIEGSLYKLFIQLHYIVTTPWKLGALSFASVPLEQWPWVII